MLFQAIVISLLFKDVYCTVVFAEAGSTAVLPCQSSPQPVSPAVAWRGDNGPIWRMQKSGVQLWGGRWVSRVTCPHTQFHRGDYSLHVRGVTAADAGSYSCTLELHNGARESTSVTLRVVTVSIIPVAAVTGQTVRLRCRVDREDWPSWTKVHWTLNGRPYEPWDTPVGSRRFKALRNTELSVKAADGVKGNWTCVVKHKEKELRVSARLDVRGIVRPSSDGSQVYAAVGSEVTLPCVLSPGSTPSDAIWERIHNTSASEPAQGTPRPPLSRPVAPVSGRDMSAVLSDVSFEDGGWYSCSATVEGYRIRRSMQLVTAKVLAEVLSDKEDALQLTCVLSDQSNVTEYEWIYAPVDLNGTQFTASVQKGRTVTLSLESEGQWTCRFYGTQGVLGNVTFHNQHVERQREEKPPRGFVDVAVPLGLSLLVLVLLLALGQMHRNNQRRKNILLFPALEAIIHSKSVAQEMSESNRSKL